MTNIATAKVVRTLPVTLAKALWTFRPFDYALGDAPLNDQSALAIAITNLTVDN